MTSKIAKLGPWAFRNKGKVLLAWIVAFAALFVAAGQFGGDFSEDYSTPGSQSKAVSAKLAERFPGASSDTIDVVYRAEAGARAPEVRERVGALLAEAEALPQIGRATPAEVAPDGRTAIARLQLDVQGAAQVPDASIDRLLVLAERATSQGLQVELAGQAIGDRQESGPSSETIGLVVALFILLLTFGSVIAAGLPIVTALFGLGMGTAGIALISAVADVPDWATQVAAMIGIGVGIDYALLIITRYRAALAAGKDRPAAIAEASATAGAAVLVAGTTVVIAMLGLFLVGLSYLNGVALSASATVLIVMLASVTLLPALLGLLGRRFDALRIPGTNRSRDPGASARWERWAAFVQRRRWPAAIAGLLVVVLLAAPVVGLRLGFPDAGNDPESTTTRQAYELVSGGFGPGANGPLLLVSDAAGAKEVAAAAEKTPGVAAVAPPRVNPAGDTAVTMVTPEFSPQDERTDQLVERLRDDTLPATGVEVDVGGTTASSLDQSTFTADRLPLFIGGVVLLSFLLLMATFRSVVIAAKAAVMNLLSIAAAYGVVALVAEGGFFGQLVGIDTPTPVPAFIPVMMFAVLFGLSMDYEVFLLSRVREEFLKTGDTARAVSAGLAKTGRVITAAAAIMIAVFAAFAFSSQVFIVLIGIGLATAILVDATIVRMVLVPAVMQILGKANWWMPRWLGRLVPQPAG